jgi:hypothetical protein
MSEWFSHEVGYFLTSCRVQSLDSSTCLVEKVLKVVVTKRLLAADDLVQVGLKQLLNNVDLGLEQSFQYHLLSLNSLYERGLIKSRISTI